jgi:hypothetical protein
MCDFVCWRSTHPEVAEELVAIGWWEDRGQHYEIIHHAGYQRTKAQVAKQSIANAKNAAARWSRQKPSSCDSQSDSECEMARTGQAWIPTNHLRKRAREDADDDYAEDLPDWYAEGARGRLEELADRNMRDGYDR